MSDVIIEQILEGEDTLYGYSPSQIAYLLQTKLNSLQAKGLVPIAITPIPDFHNFSGDGGLKNIFVLCRDIPSDHHVWTVMMMGNDDGTYHGFPSQALRTSLKQFLDQQKDVVKFVVPITDHHDLVGYVSERDGLKTFLLVY